MPELPEVETVRRGLAAQVTGRVIVEARTHHARVARQHPGGGDDLRRRITSRRLSSVERRGKYLWFPLTSPPWDDSGHEPADALLAHLGMSGQFRITQHPMTEHPHLRFDAKFGDGRWLSFLDQRTFGGVGWDALVRDRTGTRSVPARWQHVAADPFEAGFDESATVADVRRRGSEIKRLLLDQTVVSGIGNIYADEALWRAGVHPRRLANRLSASSVSDVLDSAREVMGEALAQGGTSFDAMYVNVNGESGYFERSLAVYGREGEPCLKCGTAIRRLAFMNRSSYLCPRCQRAPRAIPSALKGTATRAT